MSADRQSFPDNFLHLTGHSPMRWQYRLFDLFAQGKIPAALDLPTGLGKTSVMAIWLIARALANEETRNALPRRLVYIVDRRAVVDQATEEAEKLRQALNNNATHLKDALGLNNGTLPISTLRGAHVDNRKWLDNPAALAIIVGTVDMIGSRLLFEGYGVSRKMRPYHAGLLGVDTLVVLDEAHLVPPFMHLLRALEDDASLWPKDADSRWQKNVALRPPFVVLPLSATQREQSAENDARKPFTLEEEDISHDDVAERRINARKTLCLESPVAKDWDAAFAAKAWDLAAKEGGCARVVVFCNRRDKKDDDSTGPSVMGVADAIVQKAKREKADINPPELLVGGRRVKERQNAGCNLKRLGFAGGGERPTSPGKPTFLIATSAGEVGVDFDADQMVCDLAPWERMVQRLGRVNRRGGADREAQVAVFDTSETEKKEDRKARLKDTLTLLQRIGEGGQLSSAALTALRKEVGETAIGEASTPEPLQPALTRPLVDAWSMTSLERHTGRPEVAPWLRGWIKDDPPQTRVVWRKYLPVRTDDEGKQFVPAKDANDFFDAAPPHLSEKLETETYRVAAWLMKRAEAARKTEQASEDEVVAFALDLDGSLRKSFRLHALLDEDKKANDRLARDLSNVTLIVDARLAGLKDGLLNPDDSATPRTADDGEEWLTKEGQAVTGFRVTLTERPTETPKGWRVSFRFVVRETEEGENNLTLLVEGLNEERRSESRSPQLLDEHQFLAENKARHIGERLGLTGIALEVLMLAARLHDEGKRAEKWQKAFRAGRDAARFGLTGPLAKTMGPINQNVLDGYRHEFGSLAVFEKQPEHRWRKCLPPEVRSRIEALEAEKEWRDLVLHLIAAHHGHARPMIGTRGCEDAPPSALEERAREVALRFARLQKEWGPWSLAWWEALLRAADQQASRDNDKGEGLNAPQTEET